MLSGKSDYKCIKVKNKKITRETINVSTIALIHYFFLGHLSEASVIDFKYRY